MRKGSSFKTAIRSSFVHIYSAFSMGEKEYGRLPPEHQALCGKETQFRLFKVENVFLPPSLPQ